MKLHLGCWHRYIPGWVHIDLCDMRHIDYNRDISDLKCFSDGVADIIYSSHSFEYFDRFEAVDVIAEWARVLKTGGVLRLSVPDLQALMKIYNQTGDLYTVIGPLFGRMEIDTVVGKDCVYHKSIWDEQTLTQFLQQNGFENVELWDWRETEHSEIDDHSQAHYPHMDKENGIQVSLNIQAIKK